MDPRVTFVTMRAFSALPCDHAIPQVERKNAKKAKATPAIAKAMQPVSLML